MKPIDVIAQEEAARIEVVFTDIDDTITTEGRLTPDAFHSIWRLHQSGISVVPVTGRPAGWCDHIARMWPVRGVVGENGAFYFSYDAATRRLIERHVAAPEERSLNRARLDQISTCVKTEVPRAGVASDQPYRLYDLAIDFCEDVERLSDNEIRRIVEIFERHGATAKISSIHVNGWFGHYDKLGMMRTFADEILGMTLVPHRDSSRESNRESSEDSNRACERTLYVGDSPNDEPAFAFFRYSVGVANVLDFAHQMTAPPRFITRARSGAGFCELADMLVRSRRPPDFAPSIPVEPDDHGA